MRTAAVLVSVLVSVLSSSARSEDTGPEGCRAIQDAGRRVACLEAVASSEARRSGVGEWRMSRIRRPEGGESVSMARIVDTARSDADLVGLTVRCAAQGGDPEILVAMLRPFSAAEHPQVTVSVGGRRRVFASSVAAPGVMLALPGAASSADEWSEGREIAIEVAAGGGVKGVLRTDGLRDAVAGVRAACAKG